MKGHRRMKHATKQFWLLLLGMIALHATAEYAERDEVQAFIGELAANDAFDPVELKRVFEGAVYKQSIIDAISRPAERVLNWASYQDIFLTETRVRQGIAFEKKHRATFDAVAAKWGVDRWIILAILGVETSYGRNKGRFRVIDALSTLAFDYPPRAKFFRQELRQLFLLAREQKRPVASFVGSYAGAMGYGQFIPSSYRHYAVDFNSDTFIDIWDEPADAIASVANYLAVHKWQSGGPVLSAVPKLKAAPEDVFNQGLKPTATLQSLMDYGVSMAGVAATAQVLPLKYEGKRGNEYWLGFQNFYVITRYNRSRLYAMAVFQLSQQLKEGSA